MTDAAEPEWDDLPDLGETRHDYEAYLGKFLVSFNRIENIVGKLVERALLKQGREDLVKAAIRRSLDRKLEDMELLLIAFPSAPKLPYDEIRELGHKRNELAHGHYDPWQSGSESYEIITRGGGRRSWPPSEIIPLCEAAEVLAGRLRQLEAHWDFDTVEI